MAAVALIFGSFFGLVAAVLGWSVMGMNLIACGALYLGFSFGTLSLVLVSTLTRRAVTSR